MPEEQFLTVSELARALSISERQAARWVSRVSDADRLTTDGGPTRVRLASVIELRAKATGKPSPSANPQILESDMTDNRADTRLSQYRHDVSHKSDVTVPTLAALRDELENEKRRAAVLEAERDGLTARLADTASDRDAWKEQAGRLDTRLAEALEALQRAQDEVRSARLIGQRFPMQLEASGLTDATVDKKIGSDGERQSDSEKKYPFWAFWKHVKKH